MRIFLKSEQEVETACLPLTYFRPLKELTLGILTIKEKWEKFGFELVESLDDQVDVVVNATVLPCLDLVEQIKNLQGGQVLCGGDLKLANRAGDQELDVCSYKGELQKISCSYDLIRLNAGQIRSDFSILKSSKNYVSSLDSSTTIFGKENVFVEEGVQARCVIINAENGPVYLSRNSVLMEGAVIHGPFALGKGSVLNSNSVVRAGVATGEGCVLGGEIKNALFQSFSNKGHEGYLGDSLIGSHCNLGAGTVSSNLKTSWGAVTLWSYADQGVRTSKVDKCGLIMGDFSSTAVGTILYTGVTVGCFANVFQEKPVVQKLVASFSWGVLAGYSLEKAVLYARRFLVSKGKSLTEEEEKQIIKVHDLASSLEKQRD